MKVIVRLLVIMVFFQACKEEKKEVAKMDSYVITGSAPGVVNGIRAYLKAPVNRGRFVDRDTAVVMNEKFTFTGKAERPEELTIHVNSVNGSIPFVLENASYEVKVNKDNIKNSTITETEASEAMKAYKERMEDFKRKDLKFNGEYRVAARERDSATLNEIAKQMQMHEAEEKDYIYKFIEENENNSYSLILVENLMKEKGTDADKLIAAFKDLSDDLKSSEMGQSLSRNLDILKQQKDRLAYLNVGKTPPNFEAPNPEGEIVSLEEVKGKVTIIDFWAAWCAPCRRENPNVVRIYNKYHDKGLEIVGVSLDGSSRQPNPKAAWIKAIEDDNLTWTQVSNLKYFDEPIAKMYNISSIPATYILDEDGKIAAKNLRGMALEQKVAELLE